MKKVKLLLMLVMPLLAMAQTEVKGIHFQHGKSWKEVVELAKKEHKLIFVDCYTTWCGPCKFMSKSVFTDESVGEYFNKNFVNLKVQIDSTKADKEDIKSFYADASAINKKYKIQVYPTYLIFSTNGELVHKFIGAMQVPEFLEKGKESADPSTQYYVLQKQFAKYEKDSSFLRKLTLAAWGVEDDCSKYFKAYTATQKNMFTTDKIDLLNKVTSSTKDTGFAIVLKNQDRYDEVSGKGSANKLIVRTVVNEELEKILGKGGSKTISEMMMERINKAYPKQSREILSTIKVYLYSNTKNWKNYERAISEYMKEYGEAITSQDKLNEYAWNVFDHITNKAVLEEALGWSKRSISGKNTEEPGIMDTYANLLYKLGRTQEAIEFETKAMELAPANDKGSYEEVIGKMKKGEKTWTE